MSFVRPELFAALLVLPLAAVLARLLRQRQLRLLRTFTESAVPERPPLRDRLISIAVPVLLLLAMIGPAVGERLVLVPAHGIDVLVALDASRSMTVADDDPDRIGRARRELLDLAARFRGGRLGLMTFGGDAELVCPLTHDHGGFADFVRAVDPVFVRHGGTDLGAVLRRAADGFEAKEARRVLLLVTDGENLGDPAAVDEAAWRLYGAGVEVHALVIGTEAGGPIPTGAGGFVTDAAGARVISRARDEVLRPVVDRTGGTLLMARDEAFPVARLVRERLSDLVAVGAETTMRREPVDQYRCLLPPVLAMLLLPWVPRPARRRSAAAALALLITAPVLLAFAANDGIEAAREGNARYAAGEFDGALERFDAALAGSPEHAGIRFNRAATLHRLGRFGDAAGAFDGARARAEGSLRAAAAFGAGAARARQAVRELATAGDDPRRLEGAGSLLREAKRDFVDALACGAGRDAAVDLELVSILLDELRRRDESSQQRPPARPQGAAADQDAAGDGDEGDDPDPQRASADGGESTPAEAEPTDGDEPPSGEGSVDGEGGGEARLPGGLFREEAQSLEDVVRRYERERLELDLKNARESRRRTERDW